MARPFLRQCSKLLAKIPVIFPHNSFAMLREGDIFVHDKASECYSTVMLYPIVRPLARQALRLNFRRMYFSNFDRIPKEGPVILAVNHPTAFIEPCVLACFQARTLHYLVRGDFFAKPVYRFLLENTNMIPIYRRKDGGLTKVKDNYATFERCYDALHADRALMILAEGRCIHEKRLRPIQKGVARIAFGTYQKYGMEDLQIIPIGVNYTDSNAFRSELMIEVGEAIQMRDYLATYRDNGQRAIRELTDELARRLAQHLIIIDRPEDEVLTEHLFELHRHNQAYQIWPIASSLPQRFRSEKQLADWVNAMEVEQKRDLKRRVGAYFSALENQGLSDFGLVQPQHYSPQNTVVLIIGLLPFGLGLIGNAAPVALARWVGQRLVRTVEFRHSVKLASALGFYLVYMVFLLALAVGSQNRNLLLGIVLLPFWGYFAILYQELWERWRMGRRVRQSPDQTIAGLRAQRQRLVESWR